MRSCAHVGAFGFFVPYFDRLVIRFPTPPYRLVSLNRLQSRTTLNTVPNQAPPLQDGTSLQGNPVLVLPSPTRRCAVARYALIFQRYWSEHVQHSFPPFHPFWRS